MPLAFVSLMLVALLIGVPGHGGILTRIAAGPAVGEAATAPIPRPPNEPVGFTRLAEVRFDAIPSARGALDAIGGLLVPEGWEADEAALGVAWDSTAPGSPPDVGRAVFPIGLGDGVSPTWLRYEIDRSDQRRLFISFWLKLSENWQGHATGVNKVGFAWIHGKPVVAFVAVGTGSGPLMPQIRLQDVQYERERNLVGNVFPLPVMRGAWHRWEILLVANEPGLRDGEVHWWIDGEKVGAYHDVVLAGPEQDDIWEAVTWRPVWGGRGDRVRHTMAMWMDDLYVSGAR